jgi:hypothetical protein
MNWHRMFQERALPDLAHSKWCGNPLFGPDFCRQAAFPKGHGSGRIGADGGPVSA